MPRSNRPLTQFAVRELQRVLQSSPTVEAYDSFSGNTGVVWTEEILTFSLHGRKILELEFQGDNFVGLWVFDGAFFDKRGGLSNTTRERLNGLLDELGNQCLIPEGVRVFNNKETGTSFVGRGEQRAPLGASFPPARIESDSTNLIFS